MTQDQPTFTIVICTLGLNQNLTNLLDNLRSLKENNFQNIKILVVINGSNLDIKTDKDVSVVYEKQMGYASVRNKALTSISTNTNLIFIDDDEVPSFEWLHALINMHQKYPSEIIVGPVLSRNNAERKLKSYRDQFANHYSNLRDEKLVKQGPTANMLIPSTVLRQKKVYFDVFFDKAGSEDTDFCFRMRRQGVKIRFAKQAGLYEIEKQERFDPIYLRQRYIRDAANYNVVIRRNSNFLYIVCRFCILVIRILYLKLAKIILRKTSINLVVFKKGFRSLITGKLNS